MLHGSSLASLTLGHALPACLFAAMVAAQAAALYKRALHPPASASWVLTWVLAARDAVTVAFSALVVVLFVVRRRPMRQQSPALAAPVAVTGTFLLIALPSGGLPPQSHALQLASSVLAASGVAFALWALAWLGRCFGVRPAVRGLVTTGPYRWVRHPVYLGEITFGLGWALDRWSWPAACLFVALWCLQYARASMEEQMLSAAFPTYAQYAKTTPRLLPRVGVLRRGSPGERKHAHLTR